MTISKRSDSCGNSHSDSPSPSVFGGADLGREVSVPLSLDTTGEWLRLRKPPCAKERAEGKQAKLIKEEQEAERKRLKKVFTDHAFQFLACAEAILAEPKLACVDVPITNGMAYTGPLPPATIGAYVDLWTSSPLAAQFNEHGLSLTWYISGSPLSGANACMSVWQDGICRQQSPHGMFVHLGYAYGKSASMYQRIKQEIGVVPYTLDEAAEWVEQQLAPEAYRKAISNYAYWLTRKQSEQANHEIKTTCERLCKEVDAWKNLYVNTILLDNIDKVRQLVADYRLKEEQVGAQIEQLKCDNAELKARFPKRARGCKEFQTPFHRNNKAIKRLELQLWRPESNMSKQLFPQEHPDGLNLSLPYEVEELCTIDELTKFLEAHP